MNLAELLIEPLSYGTTWRALVEMTILGIAGGVLGCWVVLYRLSYGAESLAHGMLPGLVIAALVGAPLLLGGAIGILIAAVLVVIATRTSTETADTAIAVVITALFGAGILLALSPSSPPGIQDLLFGDLLGVTLTDVAIAGAVSLTVLAALWTLHERLLAVGFDKGSERSIGVSVTSLNLILMGLVAVTILVAVQGLGTLLVAAILVGPAAAARQVTRQIGPMIAISVAVAVAAGIAGIYASYHLRTAAGASVVVALLAFYLLAALAGSLQHRQIPVRR